MLYYNISVFINESFLHMLRRLMFCILLTCPWHVYAADASLVLEPGSVLLVFWRADCLPCRQELPVLQAIAHTYQDTHIAIITLDNKAFLTAGWPANVRVLHADKLAKETLTRYGDTRRILPYSVFISADGSICRKHYGILGTKRVNAWLKQC